MSFFNHGNFTLKNLYNTFKPRKMTRVWFFAIAFLLVTEILLPLAVNYYYSYRSTYFQPAQRFPHNFKLIYKDFPSTLRYIEEHRGDYDYNIIVLGDSVMYGAGVGPGQTVAAYLQEELDRLLAGKKVRVWNLAIPGSEPGDMYFVLRRVEHLRPDAVVMDFNMLFYGPASVKDPVAFNWLYLDEGLPRDALNVLEKVYRRSPDERAGDFLASRWSLYRYRDLLNAILFDKHPRDKFVEDVNRHMRNFGLNEPVTLPPEQQKQQKLSQLAFMYQSEPIDEHTNAAYGFTRASLERLEALGVPSVVVMTAQNEEFLGDLVQNSVFRANTDKVCRLIREHDVTFVNLYGSVPGELFMDHVHLNPGGNAMMAREIAAPLAKQLAGPELQGQGERGVVAP